MAVQKNKISKAKGVEICAKLQYAGKSRKEILQEITENYKASEKTVDNWMKEARPIVAELQREAERITARENEASIVESAKRLNLTRERVLEEYAKIAYFDIRKILTVDGGLKQASELEDPDVGAIAGIESFDEKNKEGEVLGTVRKIKIWDKRAALDSICRVMGYNAPEKSEITDKSTPFTDSQVDKIINSLRSNK